MISLLKARRAAQAERGAVLVEAAIAIPLLIFLIFGGIELGSAWEARSAATSGVRTGLLRTASLGPRPEADLRTLQSIVGEIGAENVDDIGWIVIFNADAPDINDRIVQCAAAAGAGGGRGLDSLCSAYDTADLQAVAAGTLTMANFDNGGNGDDTSYTCDATMMDARFCSSSRLISGAINIGVAIQYNHQWTTGILPSDGLTYTEYSVSSTLTGEQAAAPAPTSVATTFITADNATKSGAFAYDGTGWGVHNGTSPNNWTGAGHTTSTIAFDFVVTEAGNYTMEGIILAPNGNDDSFWVTIGDQPGGDGWLWDNYTGPTYERLAVSDRHGANPVTVWLEPGVHTLTLHQREDGTFVESMELVLQP